MIQIIKKSLILISTFCLLSIPIYAQTTLVKNGKTKSRIILNEDSRENRTAANILQMFIEKISGAKLDIVTLSMNIRKGDILLGGKYPESVTQDGFYITNKKGFIEISGKGNGTIYGAVTLLEQYMGVDYWGEFEYSYPNLKTIIIPKLDKVDNPAFRYRQSQCYAMQTDSIYKLWNRLEQPKEVFAGGYWVHTANKLLPSDKYGKTHPEYYAYYKGKRHPGAASQLCYTNPEVFDIVCHNIDSIFKANPGMKMISVSQNDGNYTNCTCPNCKAIDDREEALSGSVIYFLNKLAEKFPDKEFSTLAYLYTMKPPKHIKPLPNVNIMLCDIDCKREVSLTENASGQEFVKAMEGWSKISNNIFVWDYGINFDNYLTPFPNFHILQDNIKLFKKNNATMHFSQIAGSRGGDFAEMRAYLVSKLMWNPEANVDSLIHHFLNGYYGAAGPYIYRYTQIMEGAIIGSGKDLWIYDSPISHKYGMLKPALMRRYNELFDKAEMAVKDDNVLLKRVQRTRLPLQYCELELARTEGNMDVKDIEQKLNLFEERVKEFKVPSLNERNNPPVEYCELYRSRYMPRDSKSLSKGAKVIYIEAPTGKYAKLGETALTDGLFGGATFADSWVGWEGKDGCFVVDLGSVKDIHSIDVDFLHQIGQWILFPLEVEYSYSEDGENYTLWENHKFEENKSGKVQFMSVKSESKTPIKARYVKVWVHGTNECPSWHYGVGYPSWFFIDEVTIQ